MDIQKQLEESAEYIRQQTAMKPRLGIVLGSGLGAFVREVEVETQIKYDEIPAFAPPTVEGHTGALIFGQIAGHDIAVLQGRVHYYEGHPLHKVVHPVRTLAMLGVEAILLTNSAGGMRPDMKPGDFMVIRDHVNLTGANPLMGPNLKFLGPRFPDMTEAYDVRLRKLLQHALEAEGVRYHEGVYCGVSGPTYETPAEVRFLQIIGGHAVGMSTVPEVIAANHLGVRVAGLSCITNLAAGLGHEKLTHEDVTRIAAMVEQKFCSFTKKFVESFFAE